MPVNMILLDLNKDYNILRLRILNGSIKQHPLYIVKKSSVHSDLLDVTLFIWARHGSPEYSRESVSIMRTLD